MRVVGAIWMLNIGTKEGGVIMLTDDVIEEITFNAMQDFAEKNDGETGWSRDTIEKLVLEKGGEWSDVLRSMVLGMNLYGVEGYQLGGYKN